MRDIAVARLLRMARVRQDLRQLDVSEHAGISRTVVAEHELGQIETASVRGLRRHAEALGLSLELTVRGPAGEVLKDEEHALLTQWIKRQLDAMGWITEPEASFNVWGERGRIDLLGWLPVARIVLIDEQKTDVSDVQDLLGTLGVKERLALQIARQRGWNATSVAVLLVVSRTHRNLRTIERFSGLFERFALRGADADRWLRNPAGPARLLLLVPPGAVGRPSWRNGRRRVRRPREAGGRRSRTVARGDAPPRNEAVGDGGVAATDAGPGPEP